MAQVERCPVDGTDWAEEGPMMCCGSIVRTCEGVGSEWHDFYADTGQLQPQGQCRCGGRWDTSA